MNKLSNEVINKSNMRYTLIWNDEFDYEGTPDSQKWNFDIGNHQWPNRELQAYTNKLDNVYVKDGKLFIIAKKEKDGEREYTSTRMTTYNRASWMHGRIAVSAKLPKGHGSWPAIWMLPDDIRAGVRWPLCGEIDIMEHVGRRENQVFFSLHSEKHNHTKGTHYTKISPVEGVCEDFHEYAIEWTPSYIEFYVDDITYAKYSITDDTEDQSELSWPFNKPFHLILNIAVGGGLGGPVEDESLPFVMEVDYVRVYKLVEEDI